jgi:hypothetical protein
LSPRSVACSATERSTNSTSPSQGSASASAWRAIAARGLDALLEQGIDQRLFVGEVPVDRSHSDVSAVGDVAERGVEAALGE